MKQSRLARLLISIAATAVLCSGCLPQGEGSPFAEADPVRDTGDPGNKPLAVSWFVAEDWYHKQWDAENSLLDRMITAETGISVNITSGGPDKLSAMIASGDLPDVVTLNRTLPQRAILEDSGLMAPLDEFIPRYAPEWKVPQSIQLWYRNGDGHYYALPNYAYAPELLRKGDAIPEHEAMYARQDIMDRLGIQPEAFATKEGTVQALRKVKAAGLKYRGVDVIPAYFDIWNMQQFFGGAKENPEGNFMDRERTPEMLEAVKFLNRLYREGLMPIDSQTMVRDQIQEKINSGAVFAYTDALLLSKELTDADPNAIFVHVGPVRGDAGKEPVLDPAASIGGWTVNLLKKDTAHPERIIKFFAYMSSDIMSLNSHYGPKGAAWEFDSDGKVRYTKQRNADYDADPTAAALKYGAGSFPWFINWLPIERTQPKPVGPYEQAKRAADFYFGQFTYDGRAFDKVMTSGETEESMIEAKIKVLRKHYHSRMILASSEAEVDSLFEELIREENQAGYDKLYAYQNRVFKMAKKDFGIEYAWPANQSD